MSRLPASANPRSNSISIKGESVPIPSDELAGRPALDKHFAGKANDLVDSTIAYNPKANPKYDPMARAGANAYGSGKSIAFKPGAGMGKSLVGHELTHVTQQRAGALPKP